MVDSVEYEIGLLSLVPFCFAACHGGYLFVSSPGTKKELGKSRQEFGAMKKEDRSVCVEGDSAGETQWL